MRKAVRLAVGISILAAPAAGAADLGQVRMPDGRTASPSTVIGLEASPSFFATTTSSHVQGNYDDTSITANIEHQFGSGFLVKGKIKGDIKPDGDNQYYVEAGIGYRFDWQRFSLTPSAALGSTWGNTGFGPDDDSSALYYAFYLAGDVRLDQHWTWNAFALRYRNAVDYEWITPEVVSGVTYRIDDKTSLYGNGSYSWKDTGDGLHGDTVSVAFGLKRAL